ncbi:hypothetical protein PCC7418_0201 [Halothece sp. PCC 7418]|nr:hypothetical protein PCC7418_0201 [Halothece sp. PCC 7418]
MENAIAYSVVLVIFCLLIIAVLWLPDILGED